MMYFDFNVGNESYKLRLSTREIINLEKQLGCNPLAIFGTGHTIPTITAMVQVLHASLQQYQHGITVDQAYKMFDAYLDEGHMATDFIEVIVGVYKVSGIMKEETDTGKN